MYGVTIIEVPVRFPLQDHATIVDGVRRALHNATLRGLNVRVAVISHIASIPAFVLPVSELIEICRNHGALSLVDGAHAIGQIPINVSSLAPDFYLSNIHKWMYGPKGTAFLYVRPSSQLPRFPEPTVISSSGKPDFLGRYAYVGTRDYSAYASIPAAFDFREELGDRNVYAYCRGLALWASDHLAYKWGTRVLVPNSMQAFMVNVELPTNSTSDATALQVALDKTHSMYIVVAEIDGIIYTRLSSQVYLEKSDFERLGALVLDILQTKSSSSVFIS